MPTPPPDRGILEHFDDLVKIVSPLVVTIVGLVVYAWNTMKGTQDKTIEALNDHIEKDDDIHDKLFTQLRELEAKVAHLQGDHDGRTHDGQSCITRPAVSQENH